jgi:glutamate racemase
MGCTHYPFVIPLVKEIVGPDVVVIDPAPAIARRTEFLLKEHGWLNAEEGQADIVFYTSGNPRSLSDLLPELIGESGEVRQAVWQDGRLH